DLPKVRMEQMTIPRMKFEQMPRARIEEMMPRMHMEQMMPLMNKMREGMKIERLAPGRYRLIGPDGERVFDGANSWTLSLHGVIIMRSNKDKVEKDKVQVEKKKSEKDSKKN